MYAIPSFMTVLKILIFCQIVVEEAKRSLLCSFASFMVMSFCICHFNEGTSCMPEYEYGSF